MVTLDGSKVKPLVASYVNRFFWQLVALYVIYLQTLGQRLRQKMIFLILAAPSTLHVLKSKSTICPTRENDL